MRYFKALIAFLIVFLSVDAIWISQVAIKIYANDVPHLMADAANVPAAVIFYALYAAGVVYFSISPNFDKSTLKVACQGALLGAFAYATYTFTNYALLDGWTATIAITDTAWGAVITGLGAAAGHYAATRW